MGSCDGADGLRAQVEPGGAGSHQRGGEQSRVRFCQQAEEGCAERQQVKDVVQARRAARWPASPSHSGDGAAPP